LLRCSPHCLPNYRAKKQIQADIGQKPEGVEKTALCQFADITSWCQ